MKLNVWTMRLVAHAEKRWYEKQTVPVIFGSNVMVRVWSLLYAQLHKNYLNVISFQLGTLIRALYNAHLSFALAVKKKQKTHTLEQTVLENFMFRSESVNYVNVLICNYVYVSNVYYIIILLCQPDDMFIFFFGLLAVRSFLLFVWAHNHIRLWVNPVRLCICLTLCTFINDFVKWSATFSPRQRCFFSRSIRLSKSKSFRARQLKFICLSGDNGRKWLCVCVSVESPHILSICDVPCCFRKIKCPQTVTLNENVFRRHNANMMRLLNQTENSKPN